MVGVEEAEKIILSKARHYGIESIPLEESPGRVLANGITADRDMPPFNRSTMDGICISSTSYFDGLRQFRVIGTQAAGDIPIQIEHEYECVEIMTGAAVPDSADTVIPYEHLTMRNGEATPEKPVVKGQNIHRKGEDRKEGALLVPAGRLIDPFSVAVAASVGHSRLDVRKLPRVMIISTGNELVEVDKVPEPYQIRRSNPHMIRALLLPFGIQSHMMHLPDDLDLMICTLGETLAAYDVLLLSGGVSMGKFDYLPGAFEKLGIKEVFHTVQQRPGKPFWFGEKEEGPLVFAFPGNPVASFVCLLRYFVPWLTVSLGLPQQEPVKAKLACDFSFQPALQYFLQVKLAVSVDGSLTATPLAGNGSGDFSNLLETNAFLELPAAQTHFRSGELLPVWPYQPLSFLYR